MTELKNIYRSLTKNEKIGCLLFLITLVITQIASGSTFLVFIAGILGFFYVTLVRKGSRLCYIAGGIQIILYIYISLSSKFYGDVMLNCFNLIMQPIGWYLWSKRDNNGTVKPKKLTNEVFGLILIVWAITISIYGMFLGKLGGNTPFIDAITTVSSIAAMILSVQAFKEQWNFWLICNATSIAMWTLALTRNDSAAFPMIIMWIAYFINSVIAYREWSKR